MDLKRSLLAKKSIFRSLFVPLFLIMLLQAAIFYLAAVYGGIEESLSQNAADILTERLFNRKNELETQFHNKSFDLDACMRYIDERYIQYEDECGARPLAGDAQLQIRFLSECSDALIDTLRQNEVNGIFLILNNHSGREAFSRDGSEKKYGLCIRDMDQVSNYSGREDLLLERSPSSIVETLDCSLDSWWEAWYTFDSESHGDYYYYPLNAAWDNPGANGRDLAYFSGIHSISGSDQPVISYSVPLIDNTGYPYGVVGVELTTKYLVSLLPNNPLSDPGKPCYVLSYRDAGSDDCVAMLGNGALYSRFFSNGSVISCADATATGGFNVAGRGGIKLYGDDVQLNIYNNNNPFENRRIVLLAIAQSDALFAYIDRIKLTLLLVSLFCLALGVAGILMVSRRFAAPVTQLAGRVRDMTPQAGFRLDRLGITEIDQLVDAIEELNRNVSRNSARTEFFSRMSHDMRTPMNAIISFSSQELLEGANEDTKDDYLKKIHASGNYLLGLINEVLDITKIESNKVSLRLETIGGISLCDTTIPIIEKLAQKKNISFLRDISIDPDIYVSVDVLHVNQIVMNLLSNAVKFTPEGGTVRLTVRMTRDQSRENTVICQIIVADNGIGMSESFMKGLYTPFEQENSTREGTGLGLSIAKKLVDLMGGTIDCESRQNVGTTFTVTLPLNKTTRDAAMSESGERLLEPADLGALRKKRILVCEDNLLNAQIVYHLLDKAGVVVDIAENGQAGLEAFEDSDINEFDAILMDIQMPVMDGLDATRRIRALNRPDAAAIPIIAMTANAFDDDVRSCIAAGMNEHLAKPIETRKFFDVLLRFLSISR